MKSFKMKRFLALLLGVLMLASCSVAPDTEAGADSESGSLPTESETADALYESDLPIRDLGGSEFVMAVMDNPNIHSDSVPEELTGNILNDALFDRNTRIEQDSNVTLVQLLYTDSEFYAIENSIMAADDLYDTIMMRCTQAHTWSLEKLLVPMEDVPNVNLEKGYWAQEVNKSLSINNVQYVAEGAFNLSSYDLTFCLLFNKTLSKNLKLGDPYATVRDGKWTLELMEQHMMTATSDMNGDGTMTMDDVWGYAASQKMIAPGFWIGAGVKSISKDQDDIPYISMGEETFIDAFDWLMKITHDLNVVFDEGGNLDVPEENRQIFAEDRALYMDVSMFFIESMRDMDVDFGIIPYPKRDAAQDRYYARLSYYCPFVIPITCKDQDTAGYMLEMLNYYSYHQVIPTYYNVMLKTRASQDHESAEMLDLIFENRVVDMGDTTLCDVIRDGFIAEMVRLNRRDLVSGVKRNEKIILKRLVFPES